MTALAGMHGHDLRKHWVTRNWISAAKALQRKGKTLTEIADALNVERKAVVQALYWEVVGE